MCWPAPRNSPRINSMNCCRISGMPNKARGGITTQPRPNTSEWCHRYRPMMRRKRPCHTSQSRRPYRKVRVCADRASCRSNVPCGPGSKKIGLKKSQPVHLYSAGRLPKISKSSPRGCLALCCVRAAWSRAATGAGINHGEPCFARHLAELRGIPGYCPSFCRVVGGVPCESAAFFTTWFLAGQFSEGLRFWRYS